MAAARGARLASSALFLLLALLLACGGPDAEAPPAGEATAETGTPTEATSPASPTTGTETAATPAADGTFESVFAAVEGLTGEERQSALEEMAAQEGGELNLYTSMAEGLAESVASTFEESTGITVNLYRAGSETVTQRLLEELAAGYEEGADVVESSASDMSVQGQEGAYVPYEPPIADELLEGSVYDGWVATRLNTFVPNWNTNAVSAEEAPTSWADLADPKWDGRLAMEREDTDWYMMIRDYWLEEEGLSAEEVTARFEEMARGAIPVDGHSAAAELLAAGEFDLFAHNFTYILDRVIADGAPIAYELVEPILIQPNGVGLITDAPHPAAAVLYVDWILSPEGQQVVVDNGIVSTRTDMIPEDYRTGELLFMDVEKYIRDFESISAEYEELMRIAGDS